VLALLVLCVLLSLTTDKFLRTANLVLIVRQISINGILAVGVTYVLLTGGVDLSLGSVLALSGVVAACFAQSEALPLVIPVMAGIGAGLICGLLNGALVTLGRVAPFIVTLGMMIIARGLTYVISGGKPVANLNPSFFSIGGGELAGIPIPILLLGLVTGGSYVILKHLRIGRYIYAVGGNEEAARASGLNVKIIKTFAYTLCGAFAGLAGVVMASRVTVGQPNAGVAYELDAIAAAVIGGTSLSGGVGGVGGTILGALLMGVINNGLDLLNVSSYYQQIVKGVIIIGAVWMDKRGRDSS